MISVPTLTEGGIWAGLISALAAAIALGFNARMMVLQQRSNDATTLFSAVASIREAEARLRASSSDHDAFKTELNNYLNLLEMFAAAVNQKLFGRITRGIATDRLITDLGMLLANETTKVHLEEAVTSKKTFCELLAFWRRNKVEVDEAAASFSGA